MVKTYQKFAWLWLLISIMALGHTLPANAQSIPDNLNAHVELISEYDAAPAGAPVMLALTFELREGWHIYWRNPGDAGLPPEITWSDTPENADFEPFIWPLPKELPILPGELMDYGYDGRVTLPFIVKLPENADHDRWRFIGEADYLICKDVCIPEAQPISLILDKSETPVHNSVNGQRIARALEHVPVALTGASNIQQSETEIMLGLAAPDLTAAHRLRFFPFGHEIVHAAEQTAMSGPNGVQITLRKALPNHEITSLTGVMIAEFDNRTTGYSLNAISGEPIPGLAETALGTGGQSRPIIPFAQILIVLGFAFLGGLILNVMPCVLPVLAFKAFGMLEVAKSGNKNQLRWHGFLYTLGVLICFLALGLVTLWLREIYGIASWGQWMQSPQIVIVLIFAVILAGLWMFDAFSLGNRIQNLGQSLTHNDGASAAFFAGLLAASAGAPCVGPFLGVAIGTLFTQPAWLLLTGFLVIGLGLASPFLVLSIIPQWTRLLPKPGVWMVYTKQALAFPMFFTAAWLTITLGYLVNPEAVAMTLGGLIGVYGAIWLFNLHGGTNALKVGALIIGAISVSIPLILAHTPPSQTETETGTEAPLQTPDKRAWSESAVAEALANGQGIFVDFTAKWCATCQVNKRLVLDTEVFRETLAEHNIIFMEADFTRPDANIARELQKYDRAGVPLYLYYRPGQSTPQILPEILTMDIVNDTID